MSTGFNLKSSTSLAPKRISLSFEALRSGIDFSSLVMEVLGSSFFSHKAVSSTLKICCLVEWPALMILARSSGKLAVASTLALAALPCTFMLWRWLLSLNLLKQLLLASHFSSAASSPLSDFIELKRVRALLWIRLWLKGMLWLVWFFYLDLKLSPYHQYVCFLIIHVSTGVTLLISFKTFVLCIRHLNNWCKRPDFWPVLAFDMPSSLSLIISSFWFKVREFHLNT